MAKPNDTNTDVVSQTFRALVENAEKKFARVRDLPPYGVGHQQHQHHHHHGGGGHQNHLYQKVFKAYMRLWKYQQENRTALVQSGLNRWEIGEIASRIGQLYFNQYMRTSELKFLVEAFVFYDAILSRKYFGDGTVAGGSKRKEDVTVRLKELRFYARFLLVSVILNRSEMVDVLIEKFRALVDYCKSNFRDTSFKEWKLVVQEIDRFREVDVAFKIARPMRFCATFDSNPSSRPYVARFHAKKVLKLKDAILASYHRYEVKFAEITLDTYRMMQCLEWEPSGAFYQRSPVEPINKKIPAHSEENGHVTDHSGASGLIDLNLSADLTDPNLPPNPRKAVLYRPSVTHLLAVMATFCEELPPESIMLIYLSSSGKPGLSSALQTENLGGSRRFSKKKVDSGVFSEQNKSTNEPYANGKAESSDSSDNYLWLGPSRNGGLNALYPSDIIPFTRSPLFLIIDSDNSHAFKVLHGTERGEPVALLLSPLRPPFKNLSSVEATHNGSQFTYFLTAPLQAFCQMVGISVSDTDAEAYEDAEEILSTAFSEWEVILCTAKNLNLIWAQVVSDPFLRRLILRFIFCRSVLTVFCPPEDIDQCSPTCLPLLPNAVSPRSMSVESAVHRLANHFNVADCFHFDDM